VSAPTIVAIVLAAVLGLWVLGAYNRLVRHRNDVVQAFAKLHEQLARRHRMTQEMVAQASKLMQASDAVPQTEVHPQTEPVQTNKGPAATQAAIADTPKRLQSIVATHEAARTAADFAKAAPLDAARIAVVDRAEVALSHRLARFLAMLAATPACRDDEALRRLTHDLGRGMPQIDFATQAFNHAALAYNRAAREAPTHLVARTFGFGKAAVVSPSVGKLPARRKKPRAEAAASGEAVVAGATVVADAVDAASDVARGAEAAATVDAAPDRAANASTPTASPAEASPVGDASDANANTAGGQPKPTPTALNPHTD
jgi:LemA protein